MAYLAVERSMACLGMPSSSISSGVMTWLSTSSGVMPGALRIIFAGVGEISGNASTGSFRNALTPSPTRAIASTAASRRCESAKAMSLRILVAQRRLQLGRARGRDARAAPPAKSPRPPPSPPRHARHGDRTGLVAGGRLDEDARAGVVLHQRAAR